MTSAVAGHRTRPGRLLRAVLVVAMLLAVPMVNPDVARADLAVTTDPLQQQFFDYGDASQGDRWTGSDGGYDVKLPDGRHLWIWSDTYLGRVNPDHSRAPQAFIHNSITVQNADGSLGETLYTHDDGFGDRALIPTADGQSWYWLGDGLVEGNTYKQFLYRVGGSYMVGYVGVDVATFSLPDLKLQSITSLPGAFIPGAGTPTYYGVAIVQDDAYTYIYGSEQVLFDKHLHVARVPKGHLLDGQWQYWDGFIWSTVPVSSARIRSGVADEMSVVKTQHGYRAVAQYNGIGAQIFAYTAPAPQGPWSAGTLLYTTPESNGQTVTYNAKEHPNFAGSDYIVVTYAVNTQATDGAGQYTNVDNYRPRWIDISMPSDLPVTTRAVADSYSVGQERTLDVPAPGLLANDVYGGTTRASISSAPNHGQVDLHPDGSFTFDPVAGYTGPDSFGYTLTDGVNTSSATVHVDVLAVPVTTVACSDARVSTAGPWRSVQNPVGTGRSMCQVSAGSGGSSRPHIDLAFQGDRVDVGYVSCASCGSVTVLLDGAVVSSIDERASTPQARTLQLRRLGPGRHLVSVQADLRPGAVVNLDAFAVERGG